MSLGTEAPDLQGNFIFGSSNSIIHLNAFSSRSPKATPFNSLSRRTGAPWPHYLSYVVTSLHIPALWRLPLSQRIMEVHGSLDFHKLNQKCNNKIKVCHSSKLFKEALWNKMPHSILRWNDPAPCKFLRCVTAILREPGGSVKVLTSLWCSGQTPAAAGPSAACPHHRCPVLWDTGEGLQAEAEKLEYWSLGVGEPVFHHHLTPRSTWSPAHLVAEVLQAHPQAWYSWGCCCTEAAFVLN